MGDLGGNNELQKKKSSDESNTPHYLIRLNSKKKSFLDILAIMGHYGSWSGNQSFKGVPLYTVQESKGKIRSSFE